jgi:hypothetical protein
LRPVADAIPQKVAAALRCVVGLVDILHDTPINWVLSRRRSKNAVTGSQTYGGCTPVEDFQQDRSFIAVAVDRASRVTTIALEMVVPPVLGLWIDRKLGTDFIFVSLGAVLGFCTGIMSLLKMTHCVVQPKGRKDRDENDIHQLGGGK